MGGYLNHRNMTWWADEKECSIHVSRLRVHLLAHGPRSWRTRPPSSSSSTSCGVGNVGGTASYLHGSCKRADLMFVVATIDIKMLMQFNSCIMDRYHAHFLQACLCLLWEIRGDSSTNFVQKWIASLFDLVLAWKWDPQIQKFGEVLAFSVEVLPKSLRYGPKSQLQRSLWHKT